MGALESFYTQTTCSVCIWKISISKVTVWPHKTIPISFMVSENAMKSGLIYTSNYTQSMNHNFPCE